MRSICIYQYLDRVVISSSPASMLKCLRGKTKFSMVTFNYALNMVYSIYANIDFFNPKATIMLLLLLYFSVDPCVICMIISRWTQLMSYIIFYVKVKYMIRCWCLI